MKNLVKSIFQKTLSGDQDGLRSEDAVPEQELQIATCALLLEIAHADDEFSPDEEKQIEALLQHTFGLPQAAVREIKEQSDNRRHESIDLWQFTNTIKDHYGPAEKEKVIEMVWQVVYADGTLDQHEDYLVHKLARLLSINHKRLIAAKVKVLKEKKQA